MNQEIAKFGIALALILAISPVINCLAPEIKRSKDSKRMYYFKTVLLYLGILFIVFLIVQTCD